MPVDELTSTFAALADPTRRAILTRLAQGEASVNELAEPFPISVQAVSKHLKVLERAGLITRGRSAQLRPSRIQGAPLHAAADSREQVWKEWTEPEAFADWFGGAESEVPLSSVSMDVRPGGSWRATMFADPG